MNALKAINILARALKEKEQFGELKQPTRARVGKIINWSDKEMNKV